MDKKMLTLFIELTPFLLGTGAYATGWILFRKRDRQPLRQFRVILVMGWLLSFQLFACHAVFMIGFDRGTSGQPEDDAHLDFYKSIPYVGPDGTTLYKSPFGVLLLLVGSNSAFLWLLAKERREAAGRLAAATQERPPARPET